MSLGPLGVKSNLECIHNSKFRLGILFLSLTSIDIVQIGCIIFGWKVLCNIFPMVHYEPNLELNYIFQYWIEWIAKELQPSITNQSQSFNY